MVKTCEERWRRYGSGVWIMYNYSFINSNGVVRNVLIFDTPDADTSGYLQTQEELWGETLTVEVNDRSTTLGPGRVRHAEHEYRLPQPYASWVYDESMGMWRAPVPHPTGSDMAFDDTSPDQNGYTWNEATQTWDPTE